MTLLELIESNSRRPFVELLKEETHLKFDEECYGEDYCENNCPLEELRNDGILEECLGGCREYERHMEDGQRKVYAADHLIGTVMRNGYEFLGVRGITEPLQANIDRGYVYMDWEDAYNREEGLCAGCEKYGKETCPEDVLSADCARSGSACAIERIAEIVNEVIA